MRCLLSPETFLTKICIVLMDSGISGDADREIENEERILMFMLFGLESGRVVEGARCLVSREITGGESMVFVRWRADSTRLMVRLVDK